MFFFFSIKLFFLCTFAISFTDSFGLALRNHIFPSNTLLNQLFFFVPHTSFLLKFQKTLRNYKDIISVEHIWVGFL